ncbi:MAG: peptidoglycan-binding domain-containing protein, partial [Patescibacteria group bacterium]
MPSKKFFKISIVLALVTLGSWSCVSLALAKQKSADAFDFPRSLSLGMRGNDVRSLQEFLARDPQIYPERSVTGFFGPRTREAVKKWQQKNGLEAIGIVGPKTIAKIKESNQAKTSAPTPPSSPEPASPSEPPTATDNSPTP